MQFYAICCSLINIYRVRQLYAACCVEIYYPLKLTSRENCCHFYKTFNVRKTYYNNNDFFCAKYDSHPVLELFF